MGRHMAIAPASPADARAITAADRFPMLLAPAVIRGVQLRNRLFFSSMGIDRANEDGSLSTDLFDFYRGVAAGGCGFVMLGNATVSPDSIFQPRGLRMYDQRHADAVGRLVQTCAHAGVVVGVQLQHYGAQATTTHVAGQALLSPSGVASPSFEARDPHYRVREMSLADIASVRQQFVDAASMSVRAGARLVQLQASNGYLLSSFVSPHTNRRSDEYGGSPERRARLLAEIIEGIRATVGEQVVLSVRLGVDDGIGTRGSLPADFGCVVAMLERSGIDLIEVSIGTAETHYNSGRTEAMKSYIASAVAAIKACASVPVGFAGLTASLQEAEELIANGTCDFVGMARALFADNDLVKKTLEGREHEIHRCLWDGKCTTDKFNPRYDRVYCCVNPKYLRPT
jgi:2,4-dienoyl-CoA reductase-like NADH-dependent reductase (Old Yellow Enzyme family)